ncbi:MAG: class II aldolase/adducin family protein [Desulfurococcaceae archaeon]
MVALYEELKQKIVEIMKYLEERGLNYGRSGNASIIVREAGHVLITPSGLLKSRLTPEDIVVVDLEGRLVEGARKPSSELLLHLAIYKEYKYFNAVIHAHAVYSSILALLREPLPPVLEEMVMYTGGEVRVADYAPYGTRELAENAVKALRGRSAVILANHGIVACGRDIEEALEVLTLVERAAKVYVMARMLGPVAQLPPSSIEHQRRVYAERLGL